MNCWIKHVKYWFRLGNNQFKGALDLKVDQRRVKCFNKKIMLKSINLIKSIQRKYFDFWLNAILPKVNSQQRYLLDWSPSSIQTEQPPNNGSVQEGVLVVPPWNLQLQYWIFFESWIQQRFRITFQILSWTSFSIFRILFHVLLLKIFLYHHHYQLSSYTF